jgi:hypothetical protein
MLGSGATGATRNRLCQAEYRTARPQADCDIIVVANLRQLHLTKPPDR